MITEIRTFTIQRAKRVEAIAHITEMFAHLTQKHGGSNASVLRNVTGPTNEVYAIVNWESLAAWAAAKKSISQDAELQAVVAQAAQEVILYASSTVYESVS